MFVVVTGGESAYNILCVACTAEDLDLVAIDVDVCLDVVSTAAVC